MNQPCESTEDELTQQVLAVFDKHPTESMTSDTIGNRTSSRYKGPTVRKILPALARRGLIVRGKGRLYKKVPSRPASDVLAS
jgi:hypothetical protein